MSFWERSLSCIRGVIPGTSRTCIWFIKITVAVSFAAMLLRFFNILPWISAVLTPVFVHLGLPGEAALAFVTGYFVNTYSAIAVAVTLGLDIRQVTILMTMVLCAHNMIVETAVQRKTGASAVVCVSARTLASFLTAVLMNLLIPEGWMRGDDIAASAAMVKGEISWSVFLMDLREWVRDTLPLMVRIAVMIFSLNILQGLLKEFGVMSLIAKSFRPLMHLFGLSARCSFLWLIANIVGLAYGAAAMIEEAEKGVLTKRDIRLVNLHIGMNHSNLEDLVIASAIGAVWWMVLGVRMVMAIIFVWSARAVSAGIRR